MSQSEYARQRGRARSLISRYVKQGRIVLVKGKVDVEKADVVLGFVSDGGVNKKGSDDKNDDGDNYWKEKARREAAEASLKELDLAERRKELVEVDLVAHEFSKMVDAVRQQLLSIPTKISPTVKSAKSIAEIHRLIEQSIHEALNDFGTYNANTGKPRASRASSKNRGPSKKVKARPKTKSKRVGK